MEYLRHTRPYLPFLLCIGQGLLTGIRFFPPTLCLWIGRHLLHIKLEVLSYIFKIAEKKKFTIYLLQKNRIIADMTCFNLSEYCGPNLGMKLFIISYFLSFQSCYGCIASRGATSFCRPKGCHTEYDQDDHKDIRI